MAEDPDRDERTDDEPPEGTSGRSRAKKKSVADDDLLSAEKWLEEDDKESEKAEKVELVKETFKKLTNKPSAPSSLRASRFDTAILALINRYLDEIDWRKPDESDYREMRNRLSGKSSGGDGSSGNAGDSPPSADTPKSASEPKPAGDDPDGDEPPTTSSTPPSGGLPKSGPMDYGDPDVRALFTGVNGLFGWATRRSFGAMNPGHMRVEPTEARRASTAKRIRGWGND